MVESLSAGAALALMFAACALVVGLPGCMNQPLPTPDAYWAGPDPKK